MDNGGIKLIDQPSFSSIQTSTRFQLQTSKPGRVYYEIYAIGDALYPTPKQAGAIPQTKRLHFEQEVHPRPTAYFKRSSRISVCLNDRLTPRDDYPWDGTIALKGIPPFTLDLSIKNLASSEIHKENIETTLHEWRLDIPNYIFRTVGPHLVTIDSIRDASHCRQSEVDTSRQSQWIDVAETAVIVPFDRREDYCVGEALQFQLEGNPPWKIKYVSPLLLL
jgi:nucleoporin POM152